MKKIFTFLMMMGMAAVAWATDYEEPIVVSVNGVSSEQKGQIKVEEAGGVYTLTLKNFVLSGPDGPMGVGNVELADIKGYNDGDVVLLQTKQTITITEGDDTNIPFWMASMLPPVPVELRGKIENGHLRCYIDINMESMQQVIQVAVGSGYQLRNQGFEDWHTSSDSYVEPNGWHSFESATGGWAGFAGHHISKSDDAHSGEASARIFSTKVLWAIANGTMTTGRMNAGSTTAADKANHAYLDTSSEDKDGNGDPFYTPLYSRPDSIAFWVKFKQAKANASHPYATMSAIITDGTRYQDPEDKSYNNVVAKAKNNTIAVTNGNWVRVAAPFAYTGNNVEPKAILVTLSTNADPGQGSDGDELLVDDGALIYDAALSSLSVKGQSVPNFKNDVTSYTMTINEEITADDIEAVTTSPSAHVMKEVSIEGEAYLCTVTVFGGDMEKVTVYTINVQSTATGIQTLTKPAEGKAAYFTLDGRRAATLKAGQIYLHRQADGTVSKVLR